MVEIKTLAEALPEQITRVRDLQDQFKELRGMPNVIVEPQIAMMEADIQEAIRVIAEGDTVAMLRVFQTLSEYSG